MKLSKLYTNKPSLFEPLTFAQGLNVVMAEIRLPENRKKDTHNLGKSTLGRLLDFVLLAKRDAGFFLFNHQDLFQAFVFFIEIELDNGQYITVRRGVEDASKISFKKHDTGLMDYSTLHLSEWDHQDVPFDRARNLLDGILDWRALKPWDFRKGLGYLLRSQDDFRDVFHLQKYGGKHADWKPFLAHLLGFDAETIVQHYKKGEQLEKKKSDALVVEGELGGSITDISKIEGLLLLKQKDAEKKQKLLDAFDFRMQDKDNTKKLVEDVNETIASLNSERYSLTQNRKKILSALEEDQILFDPEEAERLFREAGVLFGGQIKKDFNQLIAFNRAITDERRKFLQEERVEIEERLKQINGELNALGKKRAETLAFLSSSDVFGKYKQVANEMVLLRADIESLERQRVFLRRLQELRTEVRVLTEECTELQSKIETEVEKINSDQNSIFSEIRVFFSDIVEEVIDRKALLSVSTNRNGHLEFKAEILDESGKSTSAGLGHTYRKLLCIAFDLAVLRGHLKEGFPRFVYHDGALESLDNRKKENLITVIRQYADLGIQPIITLIDSDLPVRNDGQSVFASEEIVILLHDEGDQGRIFKMRAW